MSGHFESNAVSDVMIVQSSLKRSFSLLFFLFVVVKRKNRISFFLKRPQGPLPQRIDPTTPPSTRNAAPFVAEESGLATNATSAATSSLLANPRKSQPGLTVWKNPCSTSATVAFFVFAVSPTNVSPPPERLAPARTE